MLRPSTPTPTVSSSGIFQQRLYGGRQPVLSGQLRPFISLPGAAVIKRNEETGSNSEAKLERERGEVGKRRSSVLVAFLLQLLPLLPHLYTHTHTHTFFLFCLSLYIYASPLCFPRSPRRRRQSLAPRRLRLLSTRECVSMLGRSGGSRGKPEFSGSRQIKAAAEASRRPVTQ